MNYSRIFLKAVHGTTAAISLVSATPALGSLASTYCNGIAGGDDPVFSSCSDTNTYNVSGETLTQNGDAWADLAAGELRTVASGDRYFSIGYAGSASGLLQDEITIQGQGSNWSTNISMTMTIDGVVTGPLQNIPNLVADTYLYGFTSSETNSSNAYIRWDGSGFTTDTIGSEGNYSVDVVASGTNNYSVILTNTFAVSALNPDINFAAYLEATGGSQTTGTVISDFGNTAQLSVILPAGYSFTSDSGVFLSAIPGTTFGDVDRNHWAYEFIEQLAGSGITSGCGGGNYCPDAPVTRAQMAVFLERGMRGSDYSPPAPTGNVFNDVSPSYWAAAFIEQFALDGITAGCGNNNYCPDSEVTRDQMAVFLLRAKYGSGYSPPPPSGVFDDVPLGYWAGAWIEQLAAEKITSGCGNNNYCPEAPVTRDQMAVFLVRTFGL